MSEHPRRPDARLSGAAAPSEEDGSESVLSIRPETNPF